MKKTIYSVTILFIILNLVGCGTSYYEGTMKDSYEPMSINNANKENSAFIKVADGMGIFKIDGERKVNFVKMMFGRGLDSILVKEGFHTIVASIGRDVPIGKIMYKAKHEYFIGYLEIRDGDYRKIYVWVEDLTDKTVIYGKKVSKKDFIKNEK